MKKKCVYIHKNGKRCIRKNIRSELKLEHLRDKFYFCKKHSHHSYHKKWLNRITFFYKDEEEFDDYNSESDDFYEDSDEKKDTKDMDDALSFFQLKTNSEDKSPDTKGQIPYQANNLTKEMIEKTYKKLALQYHPDKNKGEQDKMKQLNYFRDVLLKKFLI